MTTKLYQSIPSEFKQMRKIQDGTAVEIRFGVFQCLICGEIFLGEETTHCPFCGAHKDLLVAPKDYNEDINKVGELTEQDRQDLQASIDTEVLNARYYKTMASLPGSSGLKGIFKRLSRVESEHASVFCKVLGTKKPDTEAKIDIKSNWPLDIKDSASREEHAFTLYATFAARTKNPRLKQIWTALVDVEQDHEVLESILSH